MLADMDCAPAAVAQGGPCFWAPTEHGIASELLLSQNEFDLRSGRATESFNHKLPVLKEAALLEIAICLAKHHIPRHGEA